MKLDFETWLYIIIGVIALVSKLFQNKQKGNQQGNTSEPQESSGEWGIPELDDIFNPKPSVPQPVVREIVEEPQKVQVLDGIDDAIDKPVVEGFNYSMDEYLKAMDRLSKQNGLNENAIQDSEKAAYSEEVVHQYIDFDLRSAVIYSEILSKKY